MSCVMLYSAGALWEGHDLVRHARGNRTNCQQLGSYSQDILRVFDAEGMLSLQYEGAAWSAPMSQKLLLLGKSPRCTVTASSTIVQHVCTANTNSSGLVADHLARRQMVSCAITPCSAGLRGTLQVCRQEACIH